MPSTLTALHVMNLHSKTALHLWNLVRRIEADFSRRFSYGLRFQGTAPLVPSRVGRHDRNFFYFLYLYFSRVNIEV